MERVHGNQPCTFSILAVRFDDDDAQTIPMAGHVCRLDAAVAASRAAAHAQCTASGISARSDDAQAFRRRATDTGDRESGRTTHASIRRYDGAAVLPHRD